MASRMPKSSRRPDAYKHEIVQRPAKKRPIATRRDTPSESSEAVLTSKESPWTTYRVSRIPATYDADAFREAFAISLELEHHIKVVTHSFAAYGQQYRTATITFSELPSRLYAGGANEAHSKSEWRIIIVHPLSKRDDTICVDTHFRGFTPLSPTAKEKGHLIDCVAIHGWGGHALGGFKAHDDNYVWLRDSLKHDVPQLRVFLYGYTCDLTTGDSISGVDDYADTFRRLLRDMRAENKTGTSTPLVFIAHSLGGMVLKQALIRMKESQDNRDMDNMNSVYGALFFGVPSQGMDTEALAAMVEGKPQQHDLALLDQEVGIRLRSRQHEDFCRALDFTDSKIIQFYETRKTSTIIQDSDTKEWKRGGPKKLLVNPASPTLGRPWETSDDFRVSIDANHSDMVKFSRFDQDGYIKAREELRKFAEDAVNVIENRFQYGTMKKPSLLHPEHKEFLLPDKAGRSEDIACLKSLAFPEMNYRRQDTQRAHKNTCGWITSHLSYTTWLSEGSGILWIKGKPGSGKSTLMEFLLRDFEKQELYKESIQLSFFFHGRGTMLQKNRLGMYRSLLHQLLLKEPIARAEFYYAYQERSGSQGDPGKDWNWHANELRALFMSAVELVARIQPVNIFVDALDEAKDDVGDVNTIQQVLSDFHALNDLLCGKKLRSTICFSCRHYPVVADKQGRDICVENENSEDISIFVCDELRRRLKTSEAEKQRLTELENTIINGARGVFQWAAIVVGLAIRYRNDGLPSEEIRQMLAKVPRELGDVYRHILSEVIDQEYRQKSLRLMRWVCLAEWPLTIAELWYAMNIPGTDTVRLEFSLDELGSPKHDEMTKRIRSLSGGLVELIEHEEGQILQFIHQSVNDFLLRDGLRFLDNASPGDPIGHGHHHLSLICANYMRIAEVDSSVESAVGSVKTQLPFIDYVSRFWFSHARKAEAQGVPQDYLLCYIQYCPNLIERWVKFSRMLTPQYHDDRRPENCSTLLHVASRANCLSVVEGLLLAHPDIEQMDGAGNRALHHASHGGHARVVEALLDSGALIDAENEIKETPLELAAANGHEEVVKLLLHQGADVNVHTGGTATALYGAAENGSRAIVQLLLVNGANVNALGGPYGNALQAAAYFGTEAVVQLLLVNGADVNARGGHYGNALQAAAFAGKQAVVQLLLDNGADVNARGGCYGNALQAAASAGKQAVVQLLLDNGAEVNARGGYYGNALQAAASDSNQAVVQLLLDNGADVNALGGLYGNALQAAASDGNQAVVQLLLKNGAEVNAQGGAYGNALQAAACAGRKESLKLLLEANADLVLLHYNFQMPHPSDALCLDEKVKILLERGAQIKKFYLDISKGDEHSVRLAIDNGMRMDVPGGGFKYPLHNAVGYGGDAIVSLLLEKSKNELNLVDQIGQSPLWLAASAGRLSILHKLFETGIVDLNFRGPGGSTPLWQASHYGHLDVVEWLLSKNADPNIPDEFGITPLAKAVMEGRESVAEAIRKHQATLTDEASSSTVE